MPSPKETGVIGGPEKRDIRVAEYDPSWPAKFAKHKKIIRDALGEVALRVEHIGSTAVPGLAAKPIIDILLVVPDSSDEGAYLPQLENSGYVLRVREPDFYEHRMIRTPKKDVHVHIYSPDSPEIERYILFRNELRASPKARKHYEAVKRELAEYDWPDMNAYADAKTKIVEEILESAKKNGTES